MIIVHWVGHLAYVPAIVHEQGQDMDRQLLQHFTVVGELDFVLESTKLLKLLSRNTLPVVYILFFEDWMCSIFELLGQIHERLGPLWVAQHEGTRVRHGLTQGIKPAHELQ